MMFVLDDKYFILQTIAEQRWQREAFFSIWGGHEGNFVSDPSSHCEDVLPDSWAGSVKPLSFSDQLNFYAF